MVKFDECGSAGNVSTRGTQQQQAAETEAREDKEEEEVEYDIDRLRKIEELRRILQRALGNTRYPMSARHEITSSTTETYRDYRQSARGHGPPAFPTRGAGSRRGRVDGRSRAKITERPMNVAVCTVDGGVTLFQRMDKVLDNDETETAM